MGPWGSKRVRWQQSSGDYGAQTAALGLVELFAWLHNRQPSASKPLSPPKPVSPTRPLSNAPLTSCTATYAFAA